MDDPQRKPGDGDRTALVARIRSAADLAKGAARSFGWVTSVIVVLVLIGAGSSALIAFRSSDDDSSGSTGRLFSPEPMPTDVTTDDPTGSSPGDSTQYALTVIGIHAFLSAYEARFHTTRVVDLTLYGDYAIVDVPQPRNRHAGHLYRGGEWQDFGGVTANFPGAEVVDLRALDVAALAHNIVKARRTLGVEKPTTTYAIVRYYSSSDDVPSVDIHVANQFGESGYLATTLDGKVERAYPYGDVQ